MTHFENLLFSNGVTFKSSKEFKTLDVSIVGGILHMKKVNHTGRTLWISYGEDFILYDI